MFESETKTKTMKKQFFFASLLISGLSQAQSFTQANEPQIGDSKTMYVCKSNTPSYSTVTGSGVVWDYSALVDSLDKTKDVTVITPSDLAFTGATKETSIPGFSSIFWGSNTSIRETFGFKYFDANIGYVAVKNSTNSETTFNYPQSLLSTEVSDTYVGTIQNQSFSAGAPTSCSGDYKGSVDGIGTLKLPNSTTLVNVMRHKFVETTSAMVNIGILPAAIGVSLVRTQYDYYDITNSSLPVFSYIDVQLYSVGNVVNFHQKMILSSVKSLTNGLEENVGFNFSVYPNPSQGNVTLSGDFSENASAVVLDQTGRAVASIENVVNGSSFDLSNIERGVYFVVISNNDVKTTKTITLK
jgi:hypothetical protein